MICTDPGALRVYLAEQAQLPSKLGSIDCVTFCVGALREGWNRDYSFVLEYFDRRSAVRQLRREGGLHQAALNALGPEDFIYDAPPGSIAYFDIPGSATLGLVMNDYIAIKGHNQIMRVELSGGLKGWRTK